MPTGVYTESCSIAGIVHQKAVTRTGDHAPPWEVELPAAKALSAWVKTDANTAAGNLAASHGLSTGTYDVYWDGGQRYGVECTITTNAVALEGGAGTDFPATSDATVRISQQKTINTAIDGDAIKLALVKLFYVDDTTVARGRALFEEGDGTDVYDMDTTEGLTANRLNKYDVEGGDSNPFSGDAIAVCKASHSNTAAAATLQIGLIVDSTP